MSSKVVHVLKRRDCLTILKQLLPGTNFVYLDHEDEGKNNPDVEILLGDAVSVGPLLYECPNLKWCQTTFAGPDTVIKYCSDKGQLPSATVTRFGAYLPRHMAEWTIARILEYERSFVKIRENQRKNHWDQKSFMRYRCLYDLSIGIFGFGDIGQIIGKRCKAFDMKVYGVGKTERKELPEYADGYRPFAQKDEILNLCDYICSVFPATKETDGIFDNDALKSCAERSPVFINIGRGNIINEESILRALDMGWIRHAILDVYVPEPLPADSRLWKDERVTISPHVAGCTMPSEISGFFVENYLRYINGDPLKFVIDFRKGY